MALTTAQANNLLDRVFGVSPSANRYLALFTVAPTDAGGGTEVSGDGYARQLITFEAAASRATENDAPLSFDPSEAAWGTVVAVAIMDASTAGNMLWWDTLDDPREVSAAGVTLTLAAGDLDAAFSAS